ncbi:hypothetical protein OG496_53160 [Streptomyces sp. NBC_00988]|uniref:hypothetical protein n=1 Tax=Streptomyces sp. NBC_00988 TaxID=2903704 RepID=UPI0038634157|nr:hypothetical protein OG496_53160 [Streptomyces sp. NBC_00988]
MIASIALCVGLGLLLLLGVALIRRRRNSTSAQGRSALSGASRRALETVALGLRAVAAGRPQSGRPLPDIHVVVHSGQRLTLRLAEADDDAPAPWTADVSGKEWSVDTARLRRGGSAGDGPTHPYSLTVTLGLHRGERMLVDLARLSGPIALTGDDNDVLLLAQALISEVVSGPVGTLATVVLVGSAATPSVTDGLGARSARLHTAASRGEALAVGENKLPGQRGGPSSLQTLHMGRDRGAANSRTHARRLFVVTAAQYRNERWGDTPLRGTDALLVLGYIPALEWNLQVKPDGALLTGRLGVPVDTHTARLN